MAFSTIFTNGHVPNQVKVFSVDTVEDMNAIDISQLLPGSRAFVINGSQWYMLTVKDRTWKPVDWVSSSGTYTYALVLTSLACGSDGSVSPIISFTSNQTEYNYITGATATAGTGITFTASQNQVKILVF